jgi:hypothetical protein
MRKYSHAFFLRHTVQRKWGLFSHVLSSNLGTQPKLFDFEVNQLLREHFFAVGHVQDKPFWLHLRRRRPTQKRRRRPKQKKNIGSIKGMQGLQ